ncbi:MULTISPECIES: carbon-nitrogen hydrolase family protein [unclassified Isoptericola]|uniref:carbon-nitrogen hydrolase family protein n=1 Tax=unclassified Isoptericola TaxID=2623355 RepID=UPI00271261D7|nr:MULTISPECIES: carbon-nitrogen hydrolase family protein [unclassified Isoptericola]MDO8144072.1 carbon-nitrogen hydrolase family protein [Isoptericola sp. 178]MDO8152431.1 carbon-nitrogen hydrolase family protein [Isoptericola sp. b408]
MTVRVTVAQVTVADDHEANRYLVADAFAQAAKVDADLLLLPEYSSGYHRSGVGIEHAEELDGPYVTLLRRRAAETGVAVIAGTTLPGDDPAPDGGPRKGVNALVAVDGAGELVGVYRKVHLYDAFGTRESDRLQPGPVDAEPLTIRLGDLTFGAITCYDLRFPESARRVVDAGADVLVVPAAWVAGPLKAEHWRTLLTARAIENTVVAIGVGMAGKGVTGRSVLVGPDGVVGLELDETPQLRTVDLDADELAKARAANPSLANRRYTVVPREDRGSSREG